MDAAIIATYRCNAKCTMCDSWKHPTRAEDEISLDVIKKVPDNLGRCNITGGEPMLRRDIEDMVEILSRKAQRVEISTNGYFTDRIVALAKRFPDITIRVSLEGLPKINDEIRGIKNGFDHGMRTILKLKELGIKDIGFAVTMQDENASDLYEFFRLVQDIGVEFAQAVPHNSFYFHKYDNVIADPERLAHEVSRLMDGFLRSNRPKNWFRAYLNRGLIEHIKGSPRMLPCTAGSDIFFLDPFGEIYPCNSMQESMGNLNESHFSDIWESDRATLIREKVAGCAETCWMTGTAVPAIKRHLFRSAAWVVTNKIRTHTRPINPAWHPEMSVSDRGHET